MTPTTPLWVDALTASLAILGGLAALGDTLQIAWTQRRQEKSRRRALEVQTEMELHRLKERQYQQLKAISEMQVGGTDRSCTTADPSPMTRAVEARRHG